MDLFSIVIAASSLVLSINFEITRLRNSIEIYSSRPSKGAKYDIRDETTRLELLLDVFQRNELLLTPESSLSGSQQELLRLQVESAAIGNEVLEVLELQKKKRKSFKNPAFWNHRAEDHREREFAQRLKDCGILLEDNILKTLRLCEGKLQDSETFKILDPNSQSLVTALADTSNSIDQDVRDQGLALSKLVGRLDLTSQTHQQRIDATDEHPPNFLETKPLPSSQISQPHIPDSEVKLRAKVASVVLESLRFSLMDARYEQIEHAYRDTYSWVFSNDARWDDLVEWLKNEGEMYWIFGKLGAGKSTLLKFILDDPRTPELLKSWAGSLPLCTASFFFWNSGSSEQKSQRGLLRSLLYQILSQHQELIPFALSGEWGRLYSEFSEEGDEHENNTKPTPKANFSLQALMAAFKRLISQLETPLKLCLFVDGLDEYGGEYGGEFDGDFHVILDFFVEITSLLHVKACVSTRPQATLANEKTVKMPSLIIDELTRSDIKLYVEEKLLNNSSLDSLPNSERTQLCDTIVRRSHGVFLWVRLAVDFVTKGIQNGDSESELQSILGLLSNEDDFDAVQGIDFIYEKLLLGVDKEASSRIFQLVRAARISWNEIGQVEPLTVAAMAFTDEEADFAAQAPLEEISKSDLLEKCAKTRANIVEVSANMLMVQESSFDPSEAPNALVKYAHRTVRDYLDRPEVWKQIVSQTATSNFNPYSTLLRSCFLQLKHASSDSFLSLCSTAMTAMAYAHYADKLTGKDETTLLHELDITMSWHMKKCPKFYFGNWMDYHNATIGGASTTTVWRNSFLSLAVQYGLTAYVSKQLTENKRLLKEKEGRPLLDYAVNPIPIERNYPVSETTVKFLLEHGAVPKKKYNDHTAWENALTWQYAFCEATKDGKAKVTRNKMIECLRILHHLMNHGADRKFICRLGDGNSMGVGELIELTYRDWAPDESAEIIKSLNLVVLGDTKTKGKGVRGLFYKFGPK